MIFLLSRVPRLVFVTVVEMEEMKMMEEHGCEKKEEETDKKKGKKGENKKREFF